jgi:hypothetical protein
MMNRAAEFSSTARSSSRKASSFLPSACSRSARKKGSTHCVLRSSFEHPRIVAALGRTLEVTQGFLKPFPRAATPTVPALADQIIRVEGLEVVTHSRAVADPRAEFPQDLLHFPHRHRDGMLGDQRSVPCLVNHLLIIDVPPAVLSQNAQHVQSLRPDFDLHTISHQPRPGRVQTERAKRDGFDGDSHLTNLKSAAMPNVR